MNRKNPILLLFLSFILLFSAPAFATETPEETLLRVGIDCHNPQGPAQQNLCGSNNETENIDVFKIDADRILIIRRYREPAKDTREYPNGYFFEHEYYIQNIHKNVTITAKKCDEIAAVHYIDKVPQPPIVELDCRNRIDTSDVDSMEFDTHSKILRMSINRDCLGWITKYYTLEGETFKPFHSIIPDSLTCEEGDVTGNSAEISAYEKSVDAHFPKLSN